MAAQSLNGHSGSLLLLLAGALVTLDSLVMQVSGVTCYEGFGLRTQLTDNSIVSLCQGELLVLHCITMSDVYNKLHLVGCTTANGLPVPALNTTGFCNITTNYTSIEVHGIFLNNSMLNSDKLFEFDVETHNLEQCLALANAREIPSPCTTPPPIDDPVTNISTSSNPTETETADPGINNLGRIQKNDTTDVEGEEISLYTAVCVLVVIAAVQLLVIVLLAVKLCCRGRRLKVEENGGMYTETQQEMSSISQQSLSSDKEKGSVITNTVSKDMEKEEEGGEGGGATGTDQQREEVGKISRLTSDKDKGTVIANGAIHADMETATNEVAEEEGAATVTKMEDEHNQQNSDIAKETVIGTHSTEAEEGIANESTHSTEAKERIANGGIEPAVGAKEKGITRVSSTDSVNDLTLTTIN